MDQQMIAGYARAGEVFQNPEYVKAAARAADFILTKMRDKDGRLFRLYAAIPGEKAAARGTAFLDDYAYLAHGLLNLHDATGEEGIEIVRQLRRTAITRRRRLAQALQQDGIEVATQPRRGHTGGRAGPRGLHRLPRQRAPAVPEGARDPRRSAGDRAEGGSVRAR